MNKAGRPPEDISGARYGLLLVVALSRVRQEMCKNGKVKNRRYWTCRCDCGVTKEVRHEHLKDGRAVFCCAKNHGKSINLRKRLGIRPYRWRRGTNSSLKAFYSSYIHNAKAKGRSFDLEFDKFVDLVKGGCFYCGGYDKVIAAENCCGIDRIDPGAGYEEWNVVPCCFACNRAKGVMSFAEFAMHIKKIHSRMSEWERLLPRRHA